MQVGNLVGRPPEPEFEGDSTHLVNSKIRIGIEVEAERVFDFGLPDDLRQYWNITEDGSLKDHGAEFVFSSPLRGASVVTALNLLEEYLTDIAAVCNGRTGLHVHMDARNMSTEQLTTLAVLYTLTERPLFSFAGADRLNNVFCRPVTESTEIGVFKHLFNSVAEDDFRDAFSSAHKYSALNIASIRSLGSIEFRHHYGTYNAKRIILWLNILMSLYNKAVEVAASKDPAATLNDICLLDKSAILNEVYGEYASVLRYNSEVDHQKCVHSAFDVLSNTRITARVIKRGSKVHAKIRKKLFPDEEAEKEEEVTTSTIPPMDATFFSSAEQYAAYHRHLLDAARRSDVRPAWVVLDDVASDGEVDFENPEEEV